MVTIKDNTFYKKQDITLGVSVTPQFADLPVGSLDTTVPIEAGLGASKYVLSGSVPEEVPYGASELVGGRARFLTSGVTFTDTGRLPNLEMYRVKDEIPLVEQSTGLATSGDDLFILGSFVDGDISYIHEGFEGQDKSISLSNYVVADSGKGEYDLNDTFLEWKAARDTLWFGGTGFLGFGGGSDPIQILLTYFSRTSMDDPLSQKGGLYIQPLNPNNITGKWTSQMDARNDWARWAIMKPYWKWNDIKRHIKFIPPVGKAKSIKQTQLDETPDTSENNSLWTQIATTPNQNDPYDTTLDNPLIFTESVLDAEETDSIGNAQRITQYWGTPSVKENIITTENFFSPLYSRNPQMTRFSFDNIPKPGIIDLGNYPYARYAKTGDSDYENRSNDTRLSLPEISMKMNFKNLPPALPINTDLGLQSGDGIGQACFITRGETFPLYNADHTFPLSNAMDWAGDANAHIMSGSGGFRPFRQGAVYGLSRCVAITFSNYAPLEEHDTLDKFLYYGLTNFYNKGQVKDGIVGGALFTSFETMDPADYTSSQSTRIGFGEPGSMNNLEPSRVYVQPIPVHPIRNGFSVNQANSGSLGAGYGLAAYAGPNYGASSSALMGPKIVWEPNFLLTSAVSGNNNWMSLPKDSWSNLRWVFDPYAEADCWWPRGGAQSGASQFESIYWTGTTATGNLNHAGYTGGDRASGPLILYSEGERYKVGWNKESPSPSDDKDVPFVKIPFPTSYWRPLHMTPDGDTQGMNGWFTLSGTTGTIAAGSNTFVISSSATIANTSISIGDNLVIHGSQFADLPTSSQTASGYLSLGTVASRTVSGTDSKSIVVELARPINVDWGLLSVGSGTQSPLNVLYRHGNPPNWPVSGMAQDWNTESNIFSPGSYHLADGTGEDSWWPNVMTVWFQNYRWTNGKNAEGPDWFYDASLYYKYDSQGFPDGKGMELNVLIDEIDFKNFTTEKHNASPSKGPNADVLRMEEGSTYTNKDTNGMLGSGSFAASANGGVYFPGSLSGSQFKDRPTGYNILIGLKDKANLPLNTAHHTAGTGGGVGNLLWNTFSTRDFTNLPRMGSSWPYTEWAYLSLCSGQGVNALDGKAVLKLGNQLGVASYGSGSIHGAASAGYKTWTYSGGSALSGTALSIVTGSGSFTSGTSGLWLGSGSNDYKGTDGLTQKGLTPLAVMDSGAAGEAGDATRKYTDWVEREHILASVKVTAGPGQKLKGGDTLQSNQLMVNDSTIFNEYGDDEYIIYRIGQSLTNAQLSGTASSTVALGFTKSIKLASGSSRTGEILTFNQSLNGADDGVTNLFGRGDVVYEATIAGLPGGNYQGVSQGHEYIGEMYISPKRYWLHIPVFNNPRVTGAAGLANFRKYGDASGSGYVRNYDSVCLISGAASTISSGSTYNEFSYSYLSGNTGSKGAAALYQHPWILEPNGGEDTSLILEDYGYGDFTTSGQTGGFLSKSPALLNLSGNIDRYTEFPLDGYVSTVNPEAGSVLNMTVAISGALNSQGVTFYGDDNAILDYRPHLLWTYKDELPVVSNLTVAPTIDVINEETDLYSLTNENLNALKFNWDEEADDVWYRMLFISDGDIPNKYTNSTFWLPLNDKPTTINSSTTHSWYNNVDNTSGNADIVGSLTRSNIEGLQGYNTVFASGGTTSGTITISGQTHTFVSGMSEYTIQAHCVPSTNDKGKNGYILSYDKASAGGLEIWLNSAGRVQAAFSGTASNLSGTSIASPYDGQTPTSIILTFQSGSNTGPDAELYVNGIREAYNNRANPVTISGNLVIGASGGAAGQTAAQSSGNFRGSIEEIVLWNKKYEIPPEAGEYIYDTANIEDINTSRDQLSHSARMFVFDYHNIRGKNANEVAKTNMTSWRA